MKCKDRMNQSRMFFIIAAALLCLVVASPLTAMAQEDDGETSYFSNAAQAAKAQNLADISAEMAAADTEAQEALEAAADDLEAAQNVAADADEALQDLVDEINAGLPAEDQITKEDLLAEPDAYDLTQDQLDTIDAYNAAQDDLGTAQTAFDEALADASGVSVAEIAAMRASGMGWGVIAQELGIHPSVLGNKYSHQNQIRNQNRNRNKEMASYGYGKKAGTMSSTTRDLKTGGNAYGKSKDNQGQGKGADKAGGIGKSNGKGNQGGGKGNSGGKGNNGKGNDKD